MFNPPAHNCKNIQERARLYSPKVVTDMSIGINMGYFRMKLSV